MSLCIRWVVVDRQGAARGDAFENGVDADDERDDWETDFPDQGPFRVAEVECLLRIPDNVAGGQT
jgi:hypothetical protein